MNKNIEGYGVFANDEININNEKWLQIVFTTDGVVSDTHKLKHCRELCENWIKNNKNKLWFLKNFTIKRISIIIKR